MMPLDYICANQRRVTFPPKPQKLPQESLIIVLRINNATI